jgi:hypothetical protein
MKKALLALSLSAVLVFTGIGSAMGQDEPKPKKDTVNQDTYAKPTQFYAVEDDKAKEPAKGGNTTTIAIICGAVVVVAGVVFFLLKKKK